MAETDSDDVKIWGICGGSGSGKTTLTTQLVERFGAERVLVVHHDAYYRNRPDLDFAARCAVNYDHPDSLETDLLVEHLTLLRAGRTAPLPTYDFARHLRRPDVVLAEPRPLILVEGILVFAEAQLRSCFDLRIFVDVPAEVRLERRVRRDVEERGRDAADVRRNFEEVVAPMHERFVEPHRADAEVVIEHPDRREEWLDHLLAVADGEIAALGAPRR